MVTSDLVILHQPTVTVDGIKDTLLSPVLELSAVSHLHHLSNKASFRGREGMEVCEDLRTNIVVNLMVTSMCFI